MFGIENYPLFISSGILLNITPGNDTIYILTRSIAQGRTAGIFSVLGITSGAIVHTLLAAFGISALCSEIPGLFLGITLLGGTYLVYLGIRTFTGTTLPIPSVSTDIAPTAVPIIYRQGFLTNLLNPKVALFYLSFMPQFINPSYGNKAIPFLLLGVTFMTTGTLWCMLLAVFSSRFTSILRKERRISNCLKFASGSIFIGLGIKLFFERF